MKKLLLLFIFLSLALYAQSTPQFVYKGLLKFTDNTTLGPADKTISSPCVADWNGDGKKDLIIGYFTYGAVYVFINSGTNNAPVFTSANMQRLKADGNYITSPYG